MKVPADPRLPNRGTAGFDDQLYRQLYEALRLHAQAINLMPGNVTAADLDVTDPDYGLILTSPNGTRHRVTVSDAGALVVAAL